MLCWQFVITCSERMLRQIYDVLENPYFSKKKKPSPALASSKCYIGTITAVRKQPAFCFFQT